ncbi:AraC family transcriptional regulator [Luteimonas deserti]|uniref:Helix-turn-helix transcriptional regulator n=1 Tax=Luteimonas deserti TaxID=2752306 RepID=A0A7Z0QSF8_9GAMM|nr:AraC family transcriptional regulator [Luteimonas deserti]NYZ63106.1 helix-turn-helix transcriptional regulator [Luteimonas deserti]
MQAGVPIAQMNKIPPGMGTALLARAEWSFCAMEHSRIEATRLEAPGLPFHHLALPLGTAVPRIGFRLQGHGQAFTERDELSVIEAGVGGASWWETPLEAACFYFSTDALAAALGPEVDAAGHRLRSGRRLDAPLAVQLLHALRTDAANGQPHGTLVGDALFVALAAVLVPTPTHRRVGARTGSRDWRVRRALEYIHTNLATRLDLAAIAAAASTSLFHLSRTFRVTIGCSIWQYVLRARAERALVVMRDPRLSLAAVAQAVGFDTYAGFVAVISREYGQTPARLRRTLTSAPHG